MAVDFRCERCGKLLSVNAEPGAQVQCVHCGKRVTVPAGLASFPRPQMPAGQAQQAQVGQDAPAAADEPEELYEEEGEVMLGAMARIMPWIMSVFFHVGIFLIMFLFTMVMGTAEGEKKPFVPGEVFSKDPGSYAPSEQEVNQTSVQRVQEIARPWSHRETVVNTNAGKNDIPVIGTRGGGGSGDRPGLSGGSGAPGGGKFFGGGGNAHHVVYVIDRSGSMLDTFSAVKDEMRRSIGGLVPAQDFHIVLFATGPPKENPPKRLVPATDINKIEAAEFLSKVMAQGQTDPIPALRRAFQVLDKADESKMGKMIYLLTDSDFPDNDRVLEEVRQLNKDKDVVINCFLLYATEGASQEFVKLMRTIARESGGEYKEIDALR